MSIMELIRKKSLEDARRINSNLIPPKNYSVSEFSEAHRILSVEDSPEPGKFRCWHFQRGMLDVFNEANTRRCVYMTSTQTSKTTLLMNLLMYIVCARNGGITFMLPSEVIARDYSKARFAPMIRDCPELEKRIPAGKTNGNTILYKQ